LTLRIETCLLALIRPPLGKGLTFNTARQVPECNFASYGQDRRRWLVCHPCCGCTVGGTHKWGGLRLNVPESWRSCCPLTTVIVRCFPAEWGLFGRVELLRQKPAWQSDSCRVGWEFGSPANLRPKHLINDSALPEEISVPPLADVHVRHRDDYVVSSHRQLAQLCLPIRVLQMHGSSEIR
jgi:hypothetical protein